MADAHLTAMREKMAAMAQMAEVASLQSQLAANVKNSMERIDRLMEEPSTSTAGDAEVELWKQRIAELSKTPVAVSPTLPKTQGITNARAFVTQSHAHSAPPHHEISEGRHDHGSSEARRTSAADVEACSTAEAPRASCFRRLFCCCSTSDTHHNLAEKVPLAEVAEVEEAEEDANGYYL